jgi:hypothetical protein
MTDKEAFEEQINQHIKSVTQKLVEDRYDVCAFVNGQFMWFGMCRTKKAAEDFIKGKVFEKYLGTLDSPFVAIMKTNVTTDLPALDEIKPLIRGLIVTK